MNSDCSSSIAFMGSNRFVDMLVKHMHTIDVKAEDADTLSLWPRHTPLSFAVSEVINCWETKTLITHT